MKWQPIAPIPETAHDFSSLNDALDQMHDRTVAFPQADTVASVRRADQTLRRMWAIETGVIEGIYTLRDQTAQHLAEQGFNARLIGPDDSDHQTQDLLEILADHQTAIDVAHRQAQEGWPISRTAIRQLHQIVTQHQPTYRAMNQFGQWFDATLHPGEFKKLPNNPTRVDGEIHEYCPPAQVESELDRLIEMHEEYVGTVELNPIHVAAWLHHRFAQIHPFADGNGRTCRAITEWHLGPYHYLPIVVSRHNRTRYIDALETADDGDLDQLTAFFANVQENAVRQALQA